VNEIRTTWTVIDVLDGHDVADLDRALSGR